MAIFQVFRKVSGRRRREHQPRARLAIEQFESRVMLDAIGLVDPVFAPDTPRQYVAEMMETIEAAAIATAAVGKMPGISAFQFDDGDRWSNTSSQGGGFSQGDPTTLTWSIVPDGTSIYGYADEPTSPSDLQASLNAIYGDVGVWQPILQQSLDRWGELSGITYVYEPNDDGSAWTAFTVAPGQTGVRGDIRIAGHNIDGNSGTLAYNFFPDLGDMVIDTGDMTGLNPFFGSTAGDSLRLRNVVTHESGHGLGVEHVESSDADFLMEPYINLNFDGPQYDDILAIHRGYGDKNEIVGNDSSSSPTDLGTILGGQTVIVGADAIDAVVAATDVDFVSIDDSSDIDYYSFTVDADSTLDVTLTPLGPTYNQGPEGGSQSSFNGAAQSDLSLAVVDLNGTTVLASANAAGLGGSEIILGVGLADAGEYFVRVTGADNAAQLYQLDVSVSTIVVNGPTAVDDSDSVAEDGSVAIDVLANDTAGDAAIDPTTVLASAGANGSTSVDATTGVVTYWPDADFNGTDSFSYTVRDVNGNASNAATVSVTVTPVTDFNIAALDADKLEGDGGTTPFTFEISLDSAATSTVSVDWAVDSGGDVDATDFGGVLPSGSESFSAGETIRTITIDVSGDLTIENDEAFSVSLFNPVGADIRTGTAGGNIRTDDLPPVDTFVDVANSESTLEGTTDGTFLDTHDADGVSESISENQTPGPRKSSLEHSWNIDVTGGDISVTCELIAGHNSSAESFEFEYSDGSAWQSLVTLNSTEMTSYSVTLPPSLSGPVTVRVVDTRDRPVDPVDSVLVDYLAVVSQSVGTVDYPPTITDVLVASTNWSPAFKAEIASSHGDEDGFYRIPVGDTGQLAPLPWRGVDQIRIVFSEDVAVSQGDLDLLGANVPTYAFAGFSYDPSSFTATWTVSQPLDADKLLVDLSDAVQDTTGNSLDGQWSDGASIYPSGDGAAGGNFQFRFDVLPGDANQSGMTNVRDGLGLRGRIDTVPGDAGYSAMWDFNGDGTIDVAGDDGAIRDNMFTWLPDGAPVWPSSTTESSGGIVVPAAAVQAGESDMAGPFSSLPAATSTSTIAVRQPLFTGLARLGPLSFVQHLEITNTRPVLQPPIATLLEPSLHPSTRVSESADAVAPTASAPAANIRDAALEEISVELDDSDQDTQPSNHIADHFFADILHGPRAKAGQQWRRLVDSAIGEAYIAWRR